MARGEMNDRDGALPVAELVRLAVTGFIPVGLLQTLLDRVEGQR